MVGIEIKAIAPGAFGTNFFNATDNSIDNGDDEIRESAMKVAAHFGQVAEQMQKQSGKIADPQEVADLMYTCSTEETPVHNIVGADAEMLKDMIDSMPREQFIETLSGMLLPKEQ